MLLLAISTLDSLYSIDFYIPLVLILDSLSLDSSTISKALRFSTTSASLDTPSALLALLVYSSVKALSIEEVLPYYKAKV